MACNAGGILTARSLTSSCELESKHLTLYGNASVGGSITIASAAQPGGYLARLPSEAPRPAMSLPLQHCHAGNGVLTQMPFLTDTQR